MLTDLETLAGRATAGDGRGGKRPGAGRPRKDGKPPKSKPTVKSSIEVRDVDELLENGPPPPIDIPPPPDMAADAGALNFTLPPNPAELYAGAKARKEAAEAAKKELEYRIKAGLYLPREAVRRALAESFQAVAQGLRSIPDNIERKLGLPPEVAEMVGIYIDEAMADLSYALEQINNQANAQLAE